MSYTELGEFSVGNGVKIIRVEFTGTASGGTDVSVPGVEVGDFILNAYVDNGGGIYLATTIFRSNITTADYIRQNASDTSNFVAFLIRS